MIKALYIPAQPYMDRIPAKLILDSFDPLQEVNEETADSSKGDAIKKEFINSDLDIRCWLFSLPDKQITQRFVDIFTLVQEIEPKLVKVFSFSEFSFMIAFPHFNHYPKSVEDTMIGIIDELSRFGNFVFYSSSDPEIRRESLDYYINTYIKWKN